MTPRSTQDTVRNPVLALPSARRIQDLPLRSRAELAALLRELSLDPRQQAEKCWRQSKGPMAAYWKAGDAYATHLHRVVRPRSNVHRNLRREASMPKTAWIIDWHIQRSIEILAENAGEAQEIFDKRFGSRKFLDPLRDVAVSNTLPHLKSSTRFSGGRDADQA